ncbi:MAG: MGMT family protein [Phycisphaerae bacterium]|jgi:methylated-DNA-[protein]-cysteine S-methyltransferase
MNLRFTVFKTAWGWFGLVGTDNRLIAAHLPIADCGRLKRLFSTAFGPAEYAPRYMPTLQKRIKAYYQGTCDDDFADVKLDLSGLTPFSASVLTACRKIKPRQTITYAQLALKAGNPKAIRAVGSVLARNPFPLIIPCHRVIRSDGSIGQFSAPGGSRTKSKMLQLEEILNPKQIQSTNFKTLKTVLNI